MQKSTDTIYLYLVPIDEVTREKLDLTERRRQISHFKYWVLSKILSTDIGPQDISYTQKGKPFIQGNNFSFSISHSKEYYAMAWICRNLHLGLDIESLSRKPSSKLIKRVLLESQWQEFVAQGSQVKDFLYFWTQKEAFIKARGLSIYIGLQELSFDTIGVLGLGNLVLSAYDKKSYQMVTGEFSNQMLSICSNWPEIENLELVTI